MNASLGNAPVSYGVFEMTVDTDRFLPAAERLLDEVAGAGYTGIDLGPLGFLGTGEELAARLADLGLGLCGGYIELPFHDADQLNHEMLALDALLTVFDSARGRLPGPPPRPTLAPSNSPAHQQRPGQAQADPSIGFDADGWRNFAAGMERVLRHCRERGYEPTFHPHAGTWVEAPWEIERVLDLTDVGLCLDTGHLMVGGGEPVAAVAQWASRINQVHLKDARLAVMQDVIDSGGDARQIWVRGVFCALGNGDLDTDGFLAGLAQIDYQGWIVVEQDVLAASESDFEQAVADQRANQRYLTVRGL